MNQRVHRTSHEFADLRLVVDDAEKIVLHWMVYTGEKFVLRIDVEARGQPSARLESRPCRSGCRRGNLTTNPLDVARDKYDMVLDANLRRVGAWSTAL